MQTVEVSLYSINTQALYMHIHMITQLSTHLCCHGTVWMKRTKESERYTEGGMQYVGEMDSISLIFYSVRNDESHVNCLVS